MPGHDVPTGIRPGREDSLDLDISVAHPARVYDYWLGGTENFAADRAAGDEAIAAFPGIVAAVRANRAFLARAVRYMAAAGVRQFLDIGTGIPTAGNTHEVAQRAAADARIVYVDNDPIVTMHATSLLPVTSEGATSFAAADVRDPDTILSQAQRTLDFSQPVAIMLLGILQLIPDADDPQAIVARLGQPAVPGSYLAISHPARDILAAERADMGKRLSARMPAGLVLRSRAEVARMFSGFTLVPPGLVPLDQWRPDPGDTGAGLRSTAHGGVARKHAGAVS
ncbi:MAG: hypothetical protein QOG05_649 [Streptosporangiaceae bacterium]|jgi:hypothetical protein|nr:hypothetical protein [Streptosporangiaceae bacterium]